MILGASKGVVLMAPPFDESYASKTMAAVMSAIKPGTKVLVAESFGGKDEPVDTLVANLVGVKVRERGGGNGRIAGAGGGRGFRAQGRGLYTLVANLVGV